MYTRQDEVFRKTKLNQHSKQGLVEEIGKSLTALQTNPIDLGNSFTLSAREPDKQNEIRELFFA